MKLSGVFVANLSPWDTRDRLDLSTLRSHLQWLLDCGVEGLVPCGTTGESATLTSNEREAILKLSVELCKKKAKQVIAGCGGNSTTKVLELVRQAKDMGCDAALVVSPFYNKPTQEGLLAHFSLLAEKGGLPLVLYNIPSRTGVNISPQTMATLFEHPNIVGVKEATSDFSRWIQLTEHCNFEKNSLLAGEDFALAPILSLGGAGIITASGNLVPKLFVQLYKNAVEGKWAEAYALQKKLAPLVRSLFLETNPAPLKYALSRSSEMQNSVRLPLVKVQKDTAEQIEKIMKQMEIIS